MLTGLVGTFLVGAATGLAQKLLGDGTKRVAEIGLAGFIARLEHARKLDTLPPNHTVERGAQRAGLLASSYLLSSFKENELPDVVHEPGTFPAEWVEANDKCFSQAKAWLFERALELAWNARDKERQLKTLEITRLQIQVADETVPTQTPTTMPLSYAAVEDALRKLAGTSRSIPHDVSLAVSQDVPLNAWAVGVGQRIAEASIEQVLEQGGWKNQPAVREKLSSKFLAVHGGWADTFALFFAQEIKDDTTLNAILIHLRMEWQAERVAEVFADVGALREQVAAGFEEIKRGYGPDAGKVLGLLESMSSDLSAVRSKLEAMNVILRRELANLFDMSGPRGGDDELGRLHYSRKVDSFVGRQAEIEAIRHHLGAMKPGGGRSEMFKWMALCGEGGTGKSRLAQHIVETSRDIWPRAGFIGPSAAQNRKLPLSAAALIKVPTLIVIDYAMSIGDVLPEFFHNWIQYAAEAAVPVRILLITRKPTDSLFERLRSPIEAHLNRAAIQAAEVHGPQNRLTLKKLEDVETLHLMRERMSTLAGDEPPRRISDAALMNALNRFDHARRPLFALMVADALQRDNLPGIHADIESQEPARMELFGSYLGYQERKFWISRAATMSANPYTTLKKHENLVRLSTSVSGLDENVLRANLGKGCDFADLLPLPKRMEEEGAILGELLRTITGWETAKAAGAPDSPPRGKRFPTLEPDLIGERFVLMEIKAEEEDGDKKLLSQPAGAWMSPQQVAAAAWQMSPDGASFFMRHAAQDYPATMQKHRWFPVVSSDPAVLRARSTMLRNICADVAASARVRAVTPDQLGRLFAIVTEFDGPIEELSRQDNVVLDNFGQVLRQVAEITANIINRQVVLDKTIAPIESEGEAMLRLTQRFEEEASTADASGSVSINPDAAAAALEKLDELHQKAEGMAFNSSLPFKVREAFVETLAMHISSVWWELRAELDKGGRAPARIGNQERVRRDALKGQLLALLSQEDLGESDLAAAIRLLSAVCYAENAFDAASMKLAVDRIEKYLMRNEIRALDIVTTILLFLSNYSISYLDEHSQQAAIPENAAAQIRDITLRLIDSGMKLADAGTDDIEKFVRRLSEAAQRDPFVVSSGRERAQLWEKIESFISRQAGKVRVDEDLLLFYALAGTAIEFGTDGVTRFASRAEIIQRLIALIDKGGWSYARMREPSASQLGYLMWTLGFDSAVPPDLAEQFLDALMQGAGGKAMATLRDVILETTPSDQFPARRSLPVLLRLFPKESGVLDGKNTPAGAALSLVAQMALEADGAAAATAVEHLWETGNDPESIRRRSLAMRALAIMASLYPADAPEILRFHDLLRRQPSVDSLAVGLFTGGRLSSRDISGLLTEHDAALAEATATVARKLVLAGGDPLPWLKG
jgi:hypothetical protein